MEKCSKQCGFVGLFGFPNVGKSTFLNAVVDEHISITSPKAQTTRFPIQGILCREQTQIIFVDTPGYIQSPRGTLQKTMKSVFSKHLRNVDIPLIFFDVSKQAPGKAVTFLEHIQPANPWIILNKIDQVAKPSLLLWIDQLKPFSEKIFMISALQKDGLSGILDEMQKALPRGPWLFPEDVLSNLSEALWSAEITRETVLQKIGQEVPHLLYVETVSMKRSKASKEMVIEQVIHVAEKSHKGILLGRHGEKIKQISIATRKKLEPILGAKVHLYIYVRHTPNWSEQREFYREHTLIDDLTSHET